MVRIEVRADGCRGCEICVKLCPTKVLAVGPDRKATVEAPADCIACLSCTYACPSGAIRQADYHVVKNFYRDLDFMRRAGSFL
jgi:ferredoxin